MILRALLQMSCMWGDHCRLEDIANNINCKVFKFCNSFECILYTAAFHGSVGLDYIINVNEKKNQAKYWSLRDTRCHRCFRGCTIQYHFLLTTSQVIVDLHIQVELFEFWKQWLTGNSCSVKRFTKSKNTAPMSWFLSFCKSADTVDFTSWNPHWQLAEGLIIAIS